MYVIEGLLSGEQIANILAALTDADFNDGNRTTTNAGERLKHNLELRADANRERLGKMVLQAVHTNVQLQSIALPSRYSFPMFSKYIPGMYYDFHTDAGIINLGSPTALRSDLSCTVFLAAPETYDGGELTVKSINGTNQWKLPASSAVLYRTSDLHRVETVTRSARLATVFWIQSHIRDLAQRELIIRLNTACLALAKEGTHKAESDLISSSIHDLIRMWAA